MFDKIGVRTHDLYVLIVNLSAIRGCFYYNMFYCSILWVSRWFQNVQFLRLTDALATDNVWFKYDLDRKLYTKPWFKIMTPRSLHYIIPTDK